LACATSSDDRVNTQGHLKTRFSCAFRNVSAVLWNAGSPGQTGRLCESKLLEISNSTHFAGPNRQGL
jgi:hypothetical protein